MSAGNHNFVIKQGSVFDKTLTYKDSEGDPINLTGYSATFKTRLESGTNVINLTSLSGISLGGSAGTIRLYISSETTQVYTFDQLPYDLDLIPPSGNANKFTLLEGVITLDKDNG